MWKATSQPRAALAVLLEGTGFVQVEGPNGLTRIERRPASDTSASDVHPRAGTADPMAASSKAPDELKELVVTGTHIAGEIPVGASLSTYDREDFDRFGSATVDSLARYMLENFSGADSLATINTNGNVGSLQQGAATNIFGGAGFDLLGLGPGATLTLLDGHRIAPGGLDGSIVDVSLIPFERDRSYRGADRRSLRHLRFRCGSGRRQYRDPPRPGRRGNERSLRAIDGGRRGSVHRITACWGTLGRAATCSSITSTMTAKASMRPKEAGSDPKTARTR